MEKEKNTTNYCYHCKSYDCDIDEDGHEDEWCKRRRVHFNKGSDKIDCSTFIPIEERCEVCYKEKKITEFYHIGYPMLCSKECESKFLKKLEIENAQAEWERENLL